MNTQAKIDTAEALKILRQELKKWKAKKQSYTDDFAKNGFLYQGANHIDVCEKRIANLKTQVGELEGKSQPDLFKKESV